jgi:fused signal recognition particle receptor
VLAPAEAPAVPVEVVEPELARRSRTPEPTAGRMVRLRARLSKSQNMFGRGLLALLSRDKLDDDTWDEIEETLITADVGVEPTARSWTGCASGPRSWAPPTPVEPARLARPTSSVDALDPDADRTLKATPTGDRPAVLLGSG